MRRADQRRARDMTMKGKGVQHGDTGRAGEQHHQAGRGEWAGG
jgi:hypothetical protein